MSTDQSVSLSFADLDAMFEGVYLCRDPEVFMPWARECLGLLLYTPNGLAQQAFREEAPLYAMAYVPGIAWLACHGYKGGRLDFDSVYVRPDMRRRGIKTRFVKEWCDVWFKDETKLQWAVYRQEVRKAFYARTGLTPPPNKL